MAAIGSMAKSRVREISLVARGMAFYADGDVDRRIPFSTLARGSVCGSLVVNSALAWSTISRSTQSLLRRRR